MAWYWWLVIAGAIFGLIVVVSDHDEQYEESDGSSRLAALVIIDGLKYTHPDVWAKCASDIMGRPIDPPTPEQIAKWKQKIEMGATREDTGTIL